MLERFGHRRSAFDQIQALPAVGSALVTQRDACETIQSESQSLIGERRARKTGVGLPVILHAEGDGLRTAFAIKLGNHVQRAVYAGRQPGSRDDFAVVNVAFVMNDPDVRRCRREAVNQGRSRRRREAVEQTGFR